MLAQTCASIVYRRLARKAAACTGALPAQLERRLRLAAGEVGRASKVLSLVPYDRIRLGLPFLPSTAEPASAHMRWDTILPDGTRIPYQPKRA